MNRKEIKSVLAAPLVLALGFGGIATIQGCTNPSSTATDAAPAADAPAKDQTAMTGHEGHNHGPVSGDGTGSEKMNHAMGTSGMEALKPLKGKEFDIAFLSQMIAHHQAALQMAEQALKSSQEPTTKQAAQNVVTSQTGEIKQMTDWLKAWYAVAPSQEQQALVNADMKSMMAMPLTSDRMFFEMMIPHHQGAIDMSKLVPERTGRAEVKQLAQEIIAAQEKEIAEYKGLIASP